MIIILLIINKHSHLVLLVHFDPPLKEKLHSFLVFACHCEMKCSPVGLKSTGRFIPYFCKITMISCVSCQILYTPHSSR